MKNSKAVHWCTVCGKVANPIIIVSVRAKTFYFCLKHALQFKDELDNQLAGVKDLEVIRIWAVKEGCESF